MPARATLVSSLADILEPSSDCDALVVVAAPGAPSVPGELGEAVNAWQAHDDAHGEGVHLVVTSSAPGGRLIWSATGPLGRDHDDVRRVADAAGAGVARARDAGARAPAVWLLGVPDDPRYAAAGPAAWLGALDALWQPLEAREALGDDDVEPVERVTLVHPGLGASRDLGIASAIEVGRRLARDLGGTEPERMAPARFADHVVRAFEGTRVKVHVQDDPDVLRADYPLLLAVARGSLTVPRHRPRVVRLVWEGDGPISRTLLLAGKGVTYDTGGADLKTGGHMAGMSRDKGGAAAVAGFVATAAVLRPAGVRIVAELGLVRNSVGADAFVSDEVLVSHAGVRVRVGNTDAEGRLVLADLLSHLRGRALESVDPHLFSVATLTGHAVLAAGPYTVAIDNGPARLAGMARQLESVGDVWGEPVCVSRLRREDVAFIAPRSKADDVLSCNNKPSSQTPRGHQFPAAFLLRASGLDAHGSDGAVPLAFTHLDIGGSATRDSDWQHGRPTGAPVALLTAATLL